MRFGNRRGTTLALALATAIVTSFGLSSDSLGGDLFHVIKGEVDAVDVNTGGPYYAPPIPYGHYAKDKMGAIGKGVGGLTHGLFGKFHGLAGKCGVCGGAGLGCGACGGSGFGSGGGCGTGDCGNGGGYEVAKPCGIGKLFDHKAFAHRLPTIGHSSTVMATGQGDPSPQSVIGSPQGYVDNGFCNKLDCGIFGKHKHGLGLGQGLSGSGCGSGCGLGHGGPGCGLGLGLGHGGGTGCGACGGMGCGLCSKAKGLASGLVNKLLHRDKIKWFVGPGGPVPLTPGYTPYVVSTRSPRDFLSFAPMNPDAD